MQGMLLKESLNQTFKSVIGELALDGFDIKRPITFHFFDTKFEADYVLVEQEEEAKEP